MNTLISTKNKVYTVLAVSAILVLGLFFVQNLQKATPQAYAAVNAYMTIDGVQGQVEISSFSWGVSNSASIGSQSSGAGAGKITFNPFSITRKIDKSSPVLYDLVVKGTHIKSAVLVAADGSKLNMTDGLVKSYGWSTSSGGDNPTESISFTFQKIETTFTSSTTGS